MLREARALARLNSPAIVSVYDVVEEAERHWIVMELVDADSLGEVIRAEGPLPPDQVAAIGLTLTEALAAAHSAGVLHRDIKPGNVLLGRDGHVRLTDFGIAATDGDSTLTGTGALVGSPAYIAPERVRGSSGTPASDLWGLGATLYAAVEGQPPFEGPETYAVLTAVVEGRRRPFQLAGPLRGLLADLLDRPAESRPDVAEVRRRLRPVAGGAVPVPASVTGSDAEPVTEGKAGAGPAVDAEEHAGDDPASDEDARAHGPQIAPSATGTPAADLVTMDRSVSGTAKDGGPVAGGAAEDPAEDPAEAGTLVARRTVAAAAAEADAPSTGRAAGAPAAPAHHDRPGMPEEPVTAVAVRTRTGGAPLLDTSAATTLAGNRFTPPPFDFGGYGVGNQDDPDDGLLPVTSGVMGPAGNSTTHGHLGNGRTSTDWWRDGTPLHRGAVAAVAASLAVCVALVVGALLRSGSGTDVQLQPGGGTSPSASGAAGQRSVDPSAPVPSPKAPVGVDRLPTSRPSSPPVASTPAEPLPTATEAQPVTPSPTQVGASPTSPAPTPTQIQPTDPGPTASTPSASPPTNPPPPPPPDGRT